MIGAVPTLRTVLLRELLNLSRAFSARRHASASLSQLPAYAEYASE